MKNYSLKINGHQYDVAIDDINESSTTASVVVNGVSYNVEIDGGAARSAVKKPHVVPAPKSSGLSVTPAGAASAPVAAAPAAGGAGTISCPLPGTVLSIKVNVGDTVKVGQTLLVVEAMKMENNIDADRAGVVKSIAVREGDTVAEGAALLTIG